MVNQRLTTRATAERLGVKPQTVYAYVSRGLLTTQRSAQGSTFDALEVERLARTSRKATAGGRAAAAGRDLAFVTELTQIDNGRLRYRGLDAVELSRTRPFEAVAWWLWTASWPDPDLMAPKAWSTPAALRPVVEGARALLGPSALPIDRFGVGVAAAGAADPLRHDLSPRAVTIAGRGLIGVLLDSLPARQRERSYRTTGKTVAARLWRRLSALPPTPERVALLDAALVLVADHELAPSTLAARVAATFRANPYAVVSTGLGPASGVYHSGSTSEVERLLDDAARGGVEEAMGTRLQAAQAVHGFGMRLYPDGDPRGAALLGRLHELGGTPERRTVIDRVLAVGRERGFPPPNVDMGLAAVSFLGEMVPGAGQAIATLGRTAGWLAHAMEEYASGSTFRVRATYVGP
ncbi:MAG: hypothetical protein J2P57_22240 [Acidimicrobiaceae bacterium]|nr:hypothetical protein [Acidimicrobiaceae bacterium]